MTRRSLPTIFAQHRFSIPRERQPGVVFYVTPEMDREADAIVQENDQHEVPTQHFMRWWVEHPYVAILSETVGETEYRLQWFNRKSKPSRPFILDTRLLNADEWPLSDDQKVTSAIYIRSSILLQLYTDRERDVSVNTLTKNKPRAWARQGDTLRFAPLESLASASGHQRQRGYERPEEPSGIRMREHDVRGHWRTYPSGVRVWVRPHKRGDADLGRVDRVIG